MKNQEILKSALQKFVVTLNQRVFEYGLYEIESISIKPDTITAYVKVKSNDYKPYKLNLEINIKQDLLD